MRETLSVEGDAMDRPTLRRREFLIAATAGASLVLHRVTAVGAQSTGASAPAVALIPRRPADRPHPRPDARARRQGLRAADVPPLPRRDPARPQSEGLPILRALSPRRGDGPERARPGERSFPILRDGSTVSSPLRRGADRRRRRRILPARRQRRVDAFHAARHDGRVLHAAARIQRRWWHALLARRTRPR